MKLIVCLDNRNGMLFHNRRQSRDKAVCDRILQLCSDRAVFMNAYSANLFPTDANCLRITEEPLAHAGEDDWCFVENQDILPYCGKITQLVVYRWDRVYPADLYFPMEDITQRLKKVSATTFSGNSHPIITEEIYTV